MSEIQLVAINRDNVANFWKRASNPPPPGRFYRSAEFSHSFAGIPGKKILRDVSKLRIARILLGQQRGADSPGNIQPRIVPEYTVFIVRIVEVAALIEKLNVFGDREKAMGKSRGNVNLILIPRGEEHAGPFSEMRGAKPNIDSDIESFAFNHAAKLRLRNDATDNEARAKFLLRDCE